MNLTIKDIPIKIIDTAGIRETDEYIENIGIEKILGNKKDLIDSKKVNKKNLSNSVLMSIKNDEGEKELVEKIVKKCGSKEFENIDIFLNERQISNLTDCLKNLNDTDPIIANQLPFDLLSIEVRDGIKNLSRITGQELTEDLLNNIFSKFCIGK